jgi:heat shock protein HtpX
MLSLNLRMSLLLIILFGIVYVIVTLFMSALGITSFYFYVILAFIIMFIQYWIGPKMVEWMMRVRYVSRNEYPWLYEVVEELSRKAKIPTPKIGVSYINIPNAFAFGRGL